ncbi:MAG TPA: LPS assembly lipoprotein LptE [Caulobacteraceae bacterium]|nr:LPS assembly lipoprotein LptE [Caulobacteraceae bacterium]
MRTGPALALLLALGLAPALGACGFTPLYASPTVASGLPAIQVVAPQGRVAYLLREDLDDVLAHDKGAAPAWRLDFTLKQKRDPKGLNVNDVAERYEVGLTVDYTLTSVATGKVAHVGQISTEVFYDAEDAPYAGIAARQNSQERVASDAARRIQLDLAAWMARHKGSEGG